MHLLEVMATDGGGQRSEQNAEISISVVGPDDSPPVFQQSRYNFEVLENADRFQPVGTVHADNSDPGKCCCKPTTKHNLKSNKKVVRYQMS